MHCFFAANQIVMSSLQVTLLLQEFFQEKVESINLTTIQNARKSQKPKDFLECVLLLTNQIKPQSKYRNVQSQLENTLVTTLTRL